MKTKLNELIASDVFDSGSTQTLSKNSFANFFDVVNKGEKSYFNLCKDLNFENTEYMDQSLYSNYVIQEDDAWTIISYKFYETYELWWLICKFNGIKNPFEMPKAGTVIKIPSDEIKDGVLNIISNN